MYPTTEKRVLQERHERFMRELETRLSERLGPEVKEPLAEMFPKRLPRLDKRPLVPRQRP
jgi:hypothetical protein